MTFGRLLSANNSIRILSMETVFDRFYPLLTGPLKYDSPNGDCLLIKGLTMPKSDFMIKILGSRLFRTCLINFDQGNVN